MLEALIGSKTRIKLLTLFLLNSDRRFYVRELVRRTGSNINSVRRELKNLEGIGLLTSKFEGNLKYYGVDKSIPIYEELRSIFIKTGGVARAMKDELLRLGRIRAAFIYGSFAKGEESMKSDIDIMIIGKIAEKRLIESVKKLEERFLREINYTLFSLEEFKRRRREGESFVKNVLKEKKIALIGEIDEI